MKTIAILAALLATTTVGLAGCDSDKGPCLDKEDFVACNRSCDGPGTQESCAKRKSIASAVCAGKKTNKHFATKEEACQWLQDTK